MNILIVSQYFWPENFRINDLASRLVDKGYKVTVLTGLPNYPQGEIYNGYKWKVSRENYNNVNIIRVPLIPRGNATNLKLFLNYFSFALIASILSPFLIKGKIDKIFVFGGSPLTKMIPAILLKKIKKADLLLWVLDLWPESVYVNNRLKSKTIFYILKFMTRWFYKNSNFILIQSLAMFDSIEKNGGKTEKLVYFPSWAEDQFLSDATDFSDNFFDKQPLNCFYITFAGNIGGGQDIETILNAAEELKENKLIKWIFLGTGSKYNWLIHNIEARSLSNVHALGQKPLEIMPTYFKNSNVMLASLKNEYIYSLTLPGKVQSYMASAKPIISMINGESARIVKESNSGIALDSGDKEGLVEAALKMSEMSQKDLNTMGKNARDYYIKNFQLTNALEKLDSLFKTNHVDNES